MPIKQSITPQDVVDLLNEFIKLDPHGARMFLQMKAEVNSKVKDHPSIQTDGDPRSTTVTPMGLINGLFGTYDDGKRKGWGPIYYMMMKDGSRITEAGLLRNEPIEEAQHG
jgi:hypothetical protein